MIEWDRTPFKGVRACKRWTRHLDTAYDRALQSPGDEMIVDTNSSCIGQTSFLKKRGVKSVGRYYRKDTHPEWKITSAEAAELAAAGIKVALR